jgi:hypothetical protein
VLSAIFQRPAAPFWHKKQDFTARFCAAFFDAFMKFIFAPKNGIS